MSSSKITTPSKGKGKVVDKDDVQDISTEDAIKLERQKRIHRINLDVKRARVFISGFKGTHTLDVAIAYWLRGHYIYTTTDRVNIIPILSKPSKGHQVTLSISDAPPYNPNDPSLVEESTVNATSKTMWNIKQMAEESQELSVGAESSKRCTLPGHGAECDGKHVSEPHLTARAREGAGWTTVEPRVMGADGRVLMHWAYLHDEEKTKQND